MIHKFRIIYNPPAADARDNKRYVVHLSSASSATSVSPNESFLHFAPDRYYQDRNVWCDTIKSVKELVARSELLLVCHDAYLKQSNGVENTLKLVLQEFGLGCFKTKCATLVVAHSGEKLGWIAECIRVSMLVLEARLLSMLPANVATPAAMAAHVQRLFKDVPRTTCSVMDEKGLSKKGFRLVLAVGNSAKNTPGMITVVREGRSGKGSGSDKGKSDGSGSGSGKTICLVGKGITFDSGGLAIKPLSNMKTMKFDKIGAIYAAYAMYDLLMESSLKHHTIVGIFPFAENAVSDAAVRPGDVIESFLGKTVEITNPDAEGRLILADAFGHAHSFEPDVLLDVATLTGQANTIHCGHSGYFYSSKDDWKTLMEKGTYVIGERMIGMPSWDDGDAMLQSSVADVVNSSSKCSDAYMAAMFLKQFVPPNTDWMHIDLAHELKGDVPTGHGVCSLIYAVHAWLNVTKKK